MAHMLPQSYPNYKTVHRRFQAWCCNEVLRRVLTDVANDFCDKGALDEEECFIDATFVMAKGGGSEVGTTNRGKGMKIMAIVDRHGLPLSVSTHAANHHEVRLVQLCFDFYMIEAKPENLIGDRAYDSDPLDDELRNDGIEMIAPPAAHARSATAKSFHARLAGRALLRLDTMATSHPRPLGIPRPQLSRLRPARLPRCPLQAILRSVLIKYAFIRKNGAPTAQSKRARCERRDVTLWLLDPRRDWPPCRYGGGKPGSGPWPIMLNLALCSSLSEA
jgi:Transposase DDE domain